MFNFFIKYKTMTFVITTFLSKPITYIDKKFFIIDQSYITVI